VAEHYACVTRALAPSNDLSPQPLPRKVAAGALQRFRRLLELRCLAWRATGAANHKLLLARCRVGFDDSAVRLDRWNVEDVQEQERLRRHHVHDPRRPAEVEDAR